MKKYINRATRENKNFSALCDITANSLPKIAIEFETKPQSIKTVESYSSELINSTVNKILSDR
jgi:hypothetical protein